METEKPKLITPPPHGWINEIAKLIGCTRKTVSNAIYANTKGVKAEKARQLYRAKFNQ